ncbi:MAG: rhodanese-like domain-containing protein [Lachnospiraceae bacterium]|nr:rhodanese-like domain-containing protein [Lachnospiraceae bacterium]
MKKVCGIIIIIFLAFLLLYGWVNQSIRGVKPDSSVTQEEILDKIMSENNYIIIDVRTKKEYDEEHVVGAIHIAYDEFEENISTYVELYAGKDIIIYSGDGKESELACDTLVELGHGAYDLGVYDVITLKKE